MERIISTGVYLCYPKAIYEIFLPAFYFNLITNYLPGTTC